MAQHASSSSSRRTTTEPFVTIEGMQYPGDDDEEDEDTITLCESAAGDSAEDFGPDLGPDARDMDLMDGSWEERYYQGRAASRDWRSIYVALSLLVLLGLLVPLVLVLTR
jgi:hypothetical protein